jgi:hypothetical protein
MISDRRSVAIGAETRFPDMHLIAEHEADERSLAT